jgi:hypothetical protein
MSLEEAADKLLQDSGALGDSVYSEIQLTRQDVRHEQADSLERVWQEQVGRFEELDSVIVESAWADIKAAAIKQDIPDDTLRMIEMRQKKLTYDEIGVAFQMSAETVKKRVCRAEEKIMSLPEFGMWETITEMTNCWMSDWWRVFRDEIIARMQAGIGG